MVPREVSKAPGHRPIDRIEIVGQTCTVRMHESYTKQTLRYAFQAKENFQPVSYTEAKIKEQVATIEIPSNALDLTLDFGDKATIIPQDHLAKDGMIPLDL